MFSFSTYPGYRQPHQITFPGVSTRSQFVIPNMNRRDKKSLVYHSIWDPIELGKYLSDKHCIKLWLYLIKNSYSDTVINDINDIPFIELKLPLRSIPDIKTNFVLFTSKIDETLHSNRGDTTKLVIKLQDNHKIETVIMNHAHRNTVCLSSQIGCAMGCKFCATGSMGIIGDLTCGEIIEQFYYANRLSKIRNVVFMGMGEPLNNYNNVLEALKFLTDTKRYNLSPRHITVSTVGIIKNIYKLTEDMPLVNLALSLHAPNQDIRLKIVPTATSYHIDKLMEAIDYYIANSKNNKKYKLKFTAGNTDTINNGDENNDDNMNIINNNSDINTNEKDNNTCEKPLMLARKTSVMIEYILIKNINDRPEHAKELGELLVINDRRFHILLNLIPYNPTDTCEDFQPPSQDDIKQFNDILIDFPYNIHTRIRQEMGQDIAGACGQLVVKANKNKKELVDVEDITLTNTKVDKISRSKSKDKVDSLKNSSNHISGIISTIAFSVGFGFITYIIYKYSRNRIKM